MMYKTEQNNHNVKYSNSLLTELIVLYVQYKINSITKNNIIFKFSYFHQCL